MKISSSLLSLTLCLSFLSIAQAQTTPPTTPPAATDACTELYKPFGVWRFHRYETQGLTKDCFMSALSADVDIGLLYRSFLFTRGEIMVFNSYDGSVNSSAGTGARVFFFFPRNQTPNIEDVGDVVNMKTSFKGISLGFDFKKGTVVGFQGITATIDPKVNAENGGGVEIQSSPTLWLDVGFAQGHDPTTELNRKAIFHDIKGKTCSVKNSEIFSYFGDGDDEFKYTDAELKTFLKTRCPSLTVNY